VENPSKGYIASANNRVTTPSYNYTIALDWDEGSDGYRAQRIVDMIRASTNHTMESMMAIQQDYLSLMAVDFRDVLLRFDTSKLSSSSRKWHSKLLKWNHITDIGSKETTIFEKWVTELSTVVYDEIGGHHWTNEIYLLNTFNTTNSTDPACRTNRAYSHLLRDSADPCLDFATHAFNKVVNDNKSPQDWGKPGCHSATFVHEILNPTIIACVGDRHVDHGGDHYTVNVGPYDLAGSMEQVDGPSYRQIVDLSSMDESLFIHGPGQSGNILSVHYDDFVQKWSQGDYLPMWMNPQLYHKGSHSVKLQK